VPVWVLSILWNPFIKEVKKSPSSSHFQVLESPNLPLLDTSPVHSSMNNYYIRSLDGRRVDLITISDWSDLLDDNESSGNAELSQ
jgi:hypothetical protein